MSEELNLNSPEAARNNRPDKDPTAPPIPLKSAYVCKIHTALAIQAVYERKKKGYAVDYKSLAPRFNIQAASLRKMYSDWRCGRFVFPPEVDQPWTKKEDKELLVMGRELMRRDLALCMAAYEGAIFEVEDRLGADAGKLGKKRNEKRAKDLEGVFADLKFIRGELKAAMSARKMIDQGVDEYLEHELQNRLPEKPANPSVPVPDAVEAARSLEDDERGVAALRKMNELRAAKAIEVEVVTPAPNGS